MLPRVYIAGLYSKGDPVVNTRRAVLAADEIAGRTLPYVPHLTLLWQLIAPHEDVNFWYQYDLQWLSQCNAVWVISNDPDSKGVNAEIAYADRLGIPVFTTKEALLAWLTEEW